MRNGFLNFSFILVFTETNNAPPIPPTIPKMSAAGMRRRLLTSSLPADVPNLRVEPDHYPSIFPAFKFCNKAKKNVPIEQERNTFQIIVNLQNVFGLDIS